MFQQIGPFQSFRFTLRALRQLDRWSASGQDATVTCLKRACLEIRDKGANALVTQQAPGLYDVYRCSTIIQLSVLSGSSAAIVQDFFAFYEDVP